MHGTLHLQLLFYFKSIVYDTPRYYGKVIAEPTATSHTSIGASHRCLENICEVCEPAVASFERRSSALLAPIGGLSN